MAHAPWRVALVGLLALGSCSPWVRMERHGTWDLYRLPGEEVDAARFEEAFAPAVRAVEARLGPFRRPVRVHVWPEPRPHPARVDEILPGGRVASVPAWHQRGTDWGRPEGIYVAVPEAGAAVHELVHAWMAQAGEDLPPWFEEGLAAYLGDGLLEDGRWVVDGLACWPWQQLHETPREPQEVLRLLALDVPGSDEDDLWMHLLGWAVVFDLARETGSEDWRAWRAACRDEGPELLARRVERTLSTATPAAWLARLRDPDPARRRAAALGTWKLGLPAVRGLLLEALTREEDFRVALTLGLCAVATTGPSELTPAERLRARLSAVGALTAAAPRLEPRAADAARTLAAYLEGRPSDPAAVQEAWLELRPWWDD